MLMRAYLFYYYRYFILYGLYHTYHISENKLDSYIWSDGYSCVYFILIWYIMYLCIQCQGFSTPCCRKTRHLWRSYGEHVSCSWKCHLQFYKQLECCIKSFFQNYIGFSFRLTENILPLLALLLNPSYEIGDWPVHFFFHNRYSFFHLHLH